MPPSSSILVFRSAVVVSFWLSCLGLRAAEGTRAPYNVLFIAVDDIVDAAGKKKFSPSSDFKWLQQDTVYALMQRNWAGTGLVADIPPESVIQVNNVRGLTDTALSGWEMTTVFNPTRNWRLLLTGSINTTIESSRYAAIKTLIADDLKRMADTDDFGVFGKPGEMRVVRWALQRPRTYTLSVDVKL